MTQILLTAAGIVAVESLKAAMATVGIQEESRATLVGHFCNEWNDKTSAIADTSESPTKYVLKKDLRMPADPIWGRRAGTIVPVGTVFYKESSGYRPWFHDGSESLALTDSDFVLEG